MFNPGDYAHDTQSNERVQILCAYEVWGIASYKVYRPSDGMVYKLPAGSASAAPKNTAFDAAYIRYISLLSKIKNEISGGVLSKLPGGVIPLPHQRYVLERAISSNNIRYILADEVGLGKTIEAGLIVKELKARGLVKRVLVVCPTGLVTQWNHEMREKFGETFHVILPDEYATIRKITESDNIYGGFDQIISPMDSIKPLERRAGWTQERIEKYNEERIHSIINSGWDLIIIDEAHRVAGSSGEVARYKLGSLLSSASPYLLLLTATPHNGKTEPFLRLIRLLDKDAFPNFNAVVKQQVAPYVIRTEKRDAIDNNGNRLFKNRTTKAVNLTWDTRHSLQKELYLLVTKYVSKSYNKAMRNRGKNMWFVFLLIMMQRLVSSSTSAIRESMQRRISVLEAQNTKLKPMSEEEFALSEPEMNMDEAIEAISPDTKDEIAELSAMVALAQQAEYQYLDVKAEPLIQIIDGIYAQEAGQKVIVFTEFVATQLYLANLLTSRGYKVSVLNGSMGIEQRGEVLSEFQNINDILVSTDAGGEGLNLQFSNCVINYDLPWNPMKIEQRIGRVDRIGQTRDVTAYNFILTDTVEARVREVLEEKLSAILSELGVDKYSDILDGEQAEVNYTEAYMRSIRDPKSSTKYAASAVEDDFKKQVDNTLRIKELISDEKNLSTLVGTENNFDLDSSLRLMVLNYNLCVNNPIAAAQNYNLNDQLIISHLSREIEFTPDSLLPVLKIENFPNESGFFMLWELSVSNGEQNRRYIPVFINDDFILRPLAGSRIWDEILRETSVLFVAGTYEISPADYERLEEESRSFAYESFIALKEEHEKRSAETYRKYMYALKIRIEAAQQIGIENIKKHRLAVLEKEKADAENKYNASKAIFPDFHPEIIIRMETNNA
ncbi:MAG: DEAD/DEAH box helicase [Clostridiales bacterium]|nr:DEAD/DEAH box helicase [Clostridiales bacterium]